MLDRRSGQDGSAGIVEGPAGTVKILTVGIVHCDCGQEALVGCLGGALGGLELGLESTEVDRGRCFFHGNGSFLLGDTGAELPRRLCFGGFACPYT